jgi:hypothetical protein
MELIPASACARDRKGLLCTPAASEWTPFNGKRPTCRLRLAEWKGMLTALLAWIVHCPFGILLIRKERAA